jgi:hypothetical protein
VAGMGARSRDDKTGVNTALAVCSVVALVGASQVFLFGVVWTHGVYGSRMAWLLGVVLPLIAVAGGLALAGARYGVATGPGPPENDPHRTRPPAQPGRHDRRGAMKTLGVVSLALLGIPFALAGLLLMTYGLLFVSHWFR